ncbi:hypothetical protein cyc_01686 [Cyclospora cayetanensis]|uniref:Uncharacterized protein n=1 Tax=Cyclospora cayetanensis TaxID=88456 RepID=A0A1D3CRZ7_9EIME|nr:hypothetical protein cyc_01686 [Cyclospora cayetanensis]
MVRHLSLLWLSAACPYLLGVTWCAASGSTSSTTAEELAALINSIKTAAQATVLAAGRLQGTPSSVTSATDSSQGATSVSSSPVASRSSTVVSTGRVSSSSSRFRAPRAQQTATYSDSATGNNGLIPSTSSTSASGGRML